MRSNKLEIIQEIEEYIQELEEKNADNPYKLYFIIHALKYRLADAIVTIEEVINEME